MENKPDTAPRKRPNLFLRAVLFLVTFALVAGAVVLVVFRDRLNIDAVKRWFTYRSITTEESGQASLITHPGGAKVRFVPLGDSYLMCSTTGIRLYTSGGTEFYERVVSMTDPVITAGGSLAAVYDVGGNAVYLYDSREERTALELDGQHRLFSARMNSAGYLAVTAEASGYKAAVTIYDEQQEKRMQLNFSSVFVADAILSSNSQNVAVVTLGQENNTFQSSLSLYSLNQEEPLLTAALGNLIPLDLKFDSSTVWAVGESALVTTAANNGAQSRYDFGSRYLKDFSLEGDDFAALLLGRYRAGTSSDLLTVDAGGNELGRLPMSEQVLSVSSAGRYVAVLTSNRLDIYTSDLTLYSSLEDTENARSVVMRPDGSALLLGTTDARLYLPS